MSQPVTINDCCHLCSCMNSCLVASVASSDLMSLVAFLPRPPKPQFFFFGQNVNEQLMCSCLEPNLLCSHSTESCCFDLIAVVCCYSIDSNSLPSCLFYTDELLTRLHTRTSLGFIVEVHFEKDVEMLLFILLLLLS